MNPSPSFKDFLELNLGFVLISTSGFLGKALWMSPVLAIWIRAILASGILFGLLIIGKKSFKLTEGESKRKVLLTGGLMGIHWVTYFFALQWSGVALGMLSLFTYPVISAFLEPLILKSSFSKYQIILGLLALLGVFYLSPELSWSSKSSLGVGMGMISALAYALRNIYVKPLTKLYSARLIMAYQMFVISMLLIPLIWFFDLNSAQIKHDLPILLALAIFTTTIGHSLLVASFGKFSVTTASIMSSIQPVYGIFFAYLFLGETINRNIIIGGGLILSTVVLEGLFQIRKLKI